MKVTREGIETDGHMIPLWILLLAAAVLILIASLAEAVHTPAPSGATTRDGLILIADSCYLVGGIMVGYLLRGA